MAADWNQRMRDLGAKARNGINYKRQPCTGDGDANDDEFREEFVGRNGHAHEPAPEGEIIAPKPTPWPDPPAPEAFHGLAGEIVRRIEPETEADPTALLIQFLATFGNAAGRNTYCRVGKTWHRPNLFTVLVGDTSEGGKGESWGWVDALMKEACPEWHQESILNGISSGEGLIKVAQEVRDEGGRRVMIVEEEFGQPLRMMEREGNVLNTVVRQAWDGRRLRTATKNNALRVDDAHVGMIGHITPEELRSLMTSLHAAAGFSNRFLFVAARRSKLLPEGGADLDLTGHAFDVRAAAAQAASAGYITRSADARKLWASRYADLRAHRPGLLGKLVTRAAPQVMRLSLVYALLDCSRRIELCHLQAALAVWDYCERTCTILFGESAGSTVADEILEALQHAPTGMTRDAIRELFSRNKSSAEIDAALNLLNRQGKAVGQKLETGKQGRPPEIWKFL